MWSWCQRELDCQLSQTVHKTMSCYILFCWGLTFAFSEAIDDSQECSSVQTFQTSEGSTMWPQVMMVVVGVYLILHIISDIFKVAQLCLKRCQTSSNDETQTCDVSTSPASPTIGGPDVIQANDNSWGTVEHDATEPRAQSKTEQPVLQAESIGNKQSVKSKTDQPSSSTGESSAPVPCKCANERAHPCVLTLCKMKRDEMQGPLCIWTTTESIKYHLFEKCAGQNNVGPRQCRMMCAHCLRKKNTPV